MKVSRARTRVKRSGREDDDSDGASGAAGAVDVDAGEEEAVAEGDHCPKRVMVMHESASSDSRLTVFQLQLPSLEEPVQLAVGTTGIFQLQRLERSHGSWFIDNHLCAERGFHLLTPYDATFLALCCMTTLLNKNPHLKTVYTDGATLMTYLDEYAVLSPTRFTLPQSSTEDSEKLRPRITAIRTACKQHIRNALHNICSVTECQSQPVYKFDEASVLEYLSKKVKAVAGVVGSSGGEPSERQGWTAGVILSSLAGKASMSAGSSSASAGGDDNKREGFMFVAECIPGKWAIKLGEHMGIPLEQQATAADGGSGPDYNALPTSYASSSGGPKTAAPKKAKPKTIKPVKGVKKLTAFFGKKTSG